VLSAPVVLAGIYFWGREHLPGLEQAVSGTLLICYAIAALATAALAHWSRSRSLSWRLNLGMLTLAGFCGLSHTSIVMNMQMHTSNDPSTRIASIRTALPPGQRLVSFGRVHHLFAYYYRGPIGLEDLAENAAPADSAATYFCFSVDPGFEAPAIPFRWERIAEVSCERARSDNPRAKVVVGRRVAETARRLLRSALIDAAVTPATLEAPAKRRN